MGINPESIPRYEEPRYEETEACKDCAYCKDVRRSQNGLTEYLPVCAFEAFQADTFDRLFTAEIFCVDPEAEACEDFKEAM